MEISIGIIVTQILLFCLFLKLKRDLIILDEAIVSYLTTLVKILKIDITVLEKEVNSFIEEEL